MTEYWKSNARKFCEFCKCWLTDNQVTISFHENGKRHKESVQKHISQLSKQSAKDFKQKSKIDDELRKMEEAAMAAYMKDVQNNADITSQNINNMLDSNTSGSTAPGHAALSKKSPPLWREVKSDDGNNYYWHQETNETTWTAPDEYVSLVQQEEQRLKEEERKKAEHRINKQKQAEAIEEVKALVKREKLKERAAKKSDSPRAAVVAGPVCGPAPRGSGPYGGWSAIPERVTDENIDLQLPTSNKVYVEPPVVMVPEEIKFKEKKVESLGEGIVDFKKRKLNSNAKRNIRRKVDIDIDDC